MRKAIIVAVADLTETSAQETNNLLEAMIFQRTDEDSNRRDLVDLPPEENVQGNSRKD
jgi:hypothetical protein